MSKIHLLIGNPEPGEGADYTLCGMEEANNLTSWPEMVDCKKCLKRMNYAKSKGGES